MRRTLFLAVVVAVAGCDTRPPEQTLDEVQKAVEREDVVALRAHLSTRTKDYLRMRYGEDKIDLALSQLIQRLKPVLPLRVLESRRANESMILVVQGGQDSQSESRLRFIREAGEWKLDLLGALRTWERLPEWAEALGGNPQQSIPWPSEAPPPLTP